LGARQVGESTAATTEADMARRPIEAFAPRTVVISDPIEALAVEQALAAVRDLKRVADAAPDGQVLAATEQAAVAAGREFTRATLQTVLNRTAQEAEKKTRRAGRARAEKPGGTRGAIDARW
jgi:hypothetical protein